MVGFRQTVDDLKWMIVHSIHSEIRTVQEAAFVGNSAKS
jgi:hypothetical protein